MSLIARHTSVSLHIAINRFGMTERSISDGRVGPETIAQQQPGGCRTTALGRKRPAVTPSELTIPLACYPVPNAQDRGDEDYLMSLRLRYGAAVSGKVIAAA